LMIYATQQSSGTTTPKAKAAKATKKIVWSICFWEYATS
jgi:hypothetical protein